jgi:hypothetical protein
MTKLRIASALIISLAAFHAACTNDKKNDDKQPVKIYSPVSKELYDTILHMDSVLFNAFNAHDVDKIKPLFDEDLEFYHDKGGLSFYQENIVALKNNFDQNNGLNRTLVPGSVEVYPIKDYGAVQTGMHRFCHMENGKEDCGTFKFIHLWQRKDSAWKITRVISYDH